MVYYINVRRFINSLVGVVTDSDLPADDSNGVELLRKKEIIIQ